MDSIRKAVSGSKPSWKRWIPDTAVMLFLYLFVYHRITFPAYAIWMAFVLFIGRGGIIMLVVLALHETLTRWWGVE